MTRILGAHVETKHALKTERGQNREEEQTKVRVKVEGASLA